MAKAAKVSPFAPKSQPQVPAIDGIASQRAKPASAIRAAPIS